MVKHPTPLNFVPHSSSSRGWQFVAEACHQRSTSTAVDVMTLSRQAYLEAWPVRSTRLGEER